mmetsp:Transcript_53595/g.127732  ORF Transcript_53595/g.127732 Transcript_53595/m.127732 type:complete len:116 (+) Transcript_53595:111-458(+)
MTMLSTTILIFCVATMKITHSATLQSTHVSSSHSQRNHYLLRSRCIWCYSCEASQTRLCNVGKWGSCCHGHSNTPPCTCASATLQDDSDEKGTLLEPQRSARQSGHNSCIETSAF